MSSTPSVRYPGPSEEETALQQKQLELLEKSEAREAQWEPVVMEEMGYRFVTDPETGEQTLEQIPEEELLAGMSAQEKLAYDISKLASERELKALKGELGVDPALEREIAANQAELEERLGRQLGTGWESSTAGIQALAAQKQRAGEMRSAARKGEMTTSEALAQSRLQQLEEQSARLQQQQASAYTSPLTMAGAYESPKQWWSSQRGEQFQSKLAKANLEAQKMQGISSGFGSAMGGCCFMLFEAEGDISDDVRKLRDAFYPGDGDISKGYKIMSSTLVPMMRRDPATKRWVRRNMTLPFIKYAEWVYGKNNYGYIYEPIIETWMKAWEMVGKRGGKQYTWEEFYGIPEGSQSARWN